LAMARYLTTASAFLRPAAPVADDLHVSNSSTTRAIICQEFHDAFGIAFPRRILTKSESNVN
jgi:hypothetical protein